MLKLISFMGILSKEFICDILMVLLWKENNT